MVLIKLEYMYHAKAKDGRWVVIARDRFGKRKIVRLEPNRIKGVYYLLSNQIKTFSIFIESPVHLVVIYQSNSPYYRQLDFGEHLLKRKVSSRRRLQREGDYAEAELKDSGYKPCDKKGMGYKLECGGCWNADCCLHKAQYGYNYCNDIEFEQLVE